jgi:hypothetical protein
MWVFDVKTPILQRKFFKKIRFCFDSPRAVQKVQKRFTFYAVYRIQCEPAVHSRQAANQCRTFPRFRGCFVGVAQSVYEVHCPSNTLFDDPRKKTRQAGGFSGVRVAYPIPCLVCSIPDVIGFLWKEILLLYRVGSAALCCLFFGGSTFCQCTKGLLFPKVPLKAFFRAQNRRTDVPPTRG